MFANIIQAIKSQKILMYFFTINFNFNNLLKKNYYAYKN